MSVLNVIGDCGVVLNNSKKSIEDENVRFKNDLIALKWGIEKIKSMIQNENLPNESVTVFIGNKTVYTWLEKRVAPKEFMLILGDVLLELSFMPNKTEIILSDLVANKLKSGLKSIEKGNSITKAIDWFNTIEEG